MSGDIVIERLSKRYGSVVALDDVSLEIKTGEVFGLLGPNGAGKSTLLKTVVGILKPTAGRVRLGGFDIMEQPEKAKRLIGYVPENPALYTGLTVTEFLRFVGKIRGVNDSATLEKRIADSIVTFALAGKESSPIGSLSKGMKQKVALIAATVHDPEVLVLDEPLTALDPKMQLFVNGWIASMGRSGTTVLLSSHNLEMVQDYASRLAIIDRGKIAAVGGLDSLRSMTDAGSSARLGEVFLRLTAEDSRM